MVEKTVNLALQGGGSHGAFTWGVLDRLLEEDKISFDGVSGTSAGAMNAVVLADGLTKGGRDGAKTALKTFWHAVSQAAALSPIQRSPIDMFMGNWSIDHSPGFQWLDALSRIASPYDLNPLNYNPLLDVIKAQIDFDCVQRCDSLSLFISATNVNTGRVKVFDRHKLTAEMVMASACLPFLFQAVMIDDVPYWDGGYMGNPALFPLFSRTKSDDIIIVQINPVERVGPPKTARDIMDRVNEITFNASLLRELRAIHFVKRLKHQGQLAEDYRDLRVHRIENQDALKPLGASSKLNAEMAFLTHLHDIGFETADKWLQMHWGDIGTKSSLDLPSMFQGSTPNSDI